MVCGAKGRRVIWIKICTLNTSQICNLDWSTTYFEQKRKWQTQWMNIHRRQVYSEIGAKIWHLTIILKTFSAEKAKKGYTDFWTDRINQKTNEMRSRQTDIEIPISNYKQNVAEGIVHWIRYSRKRDTHLISTVKSWETVSKIEQQETQLKERAAQKTDPLTTRPTLILQYIGRQSDHFARQLRRQNVSTLSQRGNSENACLAWSPKSWNRSPAA